MRLYRQPREPLITIEVIQTSGGYAACYIDALLITKQTLTPLLTCARILLRQGMDPSTPIQTMRKDTGTICLQSTVGEAARLAVRETNTVGPKFVKYRAPAVEGVGQGSR